MTTPTLTTPPTTVVEAQFLAAVSPGGAFLPPTLPEVAFAGRSNVGKSSLINTLVGRKSLARISSTPGCTRTINFFHIRAADGLNFQLVDLPGYGYAKRSKAERAAWGPLLERYLLERAPLRAVILLVDVRRGLEQEEEDLLEFLRQPSPATRPQPGVVLVATKVDKLPLSQRHGALAKLKRAGVGAIGFSSVTRDGVDALWKRLRFHLLGGDEALSMLEPTAPPADPRAATPLAAPPADASPQAGPSDASPQAASAEASPPDGQGDAPSPRAAQGHATAPSGATRPGEPSRRENAPQGQREGRNEGGGGPPRGASRAPTSPRGRAGAPKHGKGPGSPQRPGGSKGRGSSNRGTKAPR